MGIGDTNIVQVGNVATDVTLRFTPAGVAVANFRLASTPRNFDKNTNEYVDGEALFLTVNVWREQAENVAESITKGMQVIVVGKLQQRTYETKEGETRTSYEIEAEHVGPSLRFATAEVTRIKPNGQGFSGNQQQGHGPGQAQGGAGFGGFSNNSNGNWG